MQYSYDLPSPVPEARRSSWFEFALVAGFFLSLLIGIAALAAFWLVYSTSTPELIAPPLSALAIEQIQPPLALQELTGDPALALAHQALAAGELATAHAVLLFDTRGHGSERAGLVLQLARRYLEREKRYSAAMIYKIAASLAILDPELGPMERSKMLIQAAEGLRATDEPAAALLIAEQAALFGQACFEPGMAKNSEIFTDLLPVAEQLDDPLFAQQVDELARNPYLLPDGIVLAPRLTDYGTPLPLAPELENAIAARELNTRRLIERIVFTGGADIEPEVRNLAAALIEEDRLRRIMYSQQMGASPALEERYWLLQQQRAWVAQQLRIARRGYGLSLIPEWESRIGMLLGELATLTANLDVLIDQLAESQLDPIDTTLIRAEGLAWVALQSELGLYPDAPLESLHQRAQVVQDTLLQFGEPLALPFGYEAAGPLPGFRILKPPSAQ